MEMQATAAKFVDWNSSWMVGVVEIDAQHKHLVSLVNDLYDGMSRGEGKKVLGKILADLVHYTKSHFASEERLLRQHGYGDFVTHKREHDQLTARVMDFQRDFEGGKAVISGDVLEFLRGWLRGHIMGTDKSYVPLLRSKGVK